jgi:hypothetical protein
MSAFAPRISPSAAVARLARCFDQQQLEWVWGWSSPPNPRSRGPTNAQLARWRDAPRACRARIDRLLDAAAPGAALAAARDLIADHDASGIERFISERLAAIYRALRAGRSSRQIVLASYARSPEVDAAVAKLFADL